MLSFFSHWFVTDFFAIHYFLRFWLWLVLSLVTMAMGGERSYDLGSRLIYCLLIVACSILLFSGMVDADRQDNGWLFFLYVCGAVYVVICGLMVLFNLLTGQASEEVDRETCGWITYVREVNSEGSDAFDIGYQRGHYLTLFFIVLIFLDVLTQK